jgi:prefoldin subunit 5
MNEQSILAKLQEYQQQLQQIQASYHAVNGAIMDCQYWLDQLKKVNDNSPN